MAHSPERPARLFHLCLLDCLTAQMINWSFWRCISALSVLDIQSHNNNKKIAFVRRLHFICHIRSMWFIDISGMQIKLPNDFLTCLFWITVHHLPCSVKREGVFIDSENELRSVLQKFFLGTKWWMLLLSSNQFVQQCMDDILSVFPQH